MRKREQVRGREREIKGPREGEKYGWRERYEEENCVDIMVAVGGVKPPRVTLKRIKYSGKQEETLKHWK